MGRYEDWREATGQDEIEKQEKEDVKELKKLFKEEKYRNIFFEEVAYQMVHNQATWGLNISSIQMRIYRETGRIPTPKVRK